MPTPCKNHPDKPSTSFGLCQSCYMKQRRAKSRSYVGRSPTGSTVQTVINLGGFEDKFLSRIDTSGGPDACHPWTHTKTKQDYGVFAKHGHTVLAHRLRFAMAEPDSINAPVIMHTCDNPRCCNPNHLRSGSFSDNMQDMSNKGRRTPPLVSHLSDRNNHPCAKPVTTPHGDFNSASLAADVVGVTPRAVALRCQKGLNGWSYR